MTKLGNGLRFRTEFRVWQGGEIRSSAWLIAALSRCVPRADLFTSRSYSEEFPLDEATTAEEGYPGTDEEMTEKLFLAGVPAPQQSREQSVVVVVRGRDVLDVAPDIGDVRRTVISRPSADRRRGP